MDPIAMLRTAQDNLNEAYCKYSNTPTVLSRDFDELKLQACIFQYEVCKEMVSFITNEPSEFSRKVALKGLIHQLYEYDLVTHHILSRIKALAAKRGIEISDSKLKEERRKWRLEFKNLREWSVIRNKATGHYDQDLASQFSSLEAIDPEQIMNVCVAFFSCNMELIKMLRDVGRQKSN